MSSYLEDIFDSWLGQHPDIPEPVKELEFHPPRKWRLDRAWPDKMFAVEIEGGLFKGGRHQSLTGFMKDAEKYEQAMLDGWTVYRVPGPWIAEGRHTWIWRQETMDTIRFMLDLDDPE